MAASAPRQPAAINPSPTSRRGPGTPGPINLEHAQFEGDAAPGLTCESCRQAIAHAYFTANKKVLCASCKEQLVAPPTGTPLGRWTRAALLGLGAAAVGAGIWYAVRALTGYEFGLIAVLIGFAVGAAVRFGSQHRGGLAYQFLAVFLTYTSITSTNVPLIIEEIEKQTVDSAVQEGAALDGSAVGAADDAGSVATAQGAAEIGPARAVVAVVALLALAYALPFLAGWQNLLGLLIIGFGLWQAWRMNGRLALEIAGPFQVSAPASAAKAA
jgi:hypothetical protein